MDSFGSLRNVHDKMADGKTACGKTCCVKFDGFLIPFGVNVSCKPISERDEARLHQIGKKMLLGFFMGHVSRAERGWSGDLLIADCEDPENLSASHTHVKNVSSTGKPHKKESCCVHVLTDLSKLFGLPEPPRGELPARENHLSMIKRMKRIPFSRRKTVKTFGS